MVAINCLQCIISELYNFDNTSVWEWLYVQPDLLQSFFVL